MAKSEELKNIVNNVLHAAISQFCQYKSEKIEFDLDKIDLEYGYLMAFPWCDAFKTPPMFRKPRWEVGCEDDEK